MSLLSNRCNDHETAKILLTEVILDALSDTAYRVALENPELLKHALSAGAADLQLGSIHEVLLDHLRDGSLPCTPLQYRALMLEPTSRGRLDPSSTKIIVVHSGNPDSAASTNSLLEQVDSEGIEIDEGFLANAVAPKSLKLNGQVGNSHLVNDVADSGPTTQVTFDVEPLVSPVLLPDDHCTLYVRTVDLGRVGLLNEDWVSLPSSPP